MSNHKSYYELLKDPRWQKKRLEVMGRRNFSCSNCLDKTETLHVHHGAYLKGLKPWEYPDEMLHCLCESCHSEVEDCLEELRKNYGMFHFSSHITDIVNICESFNKRVHDHETVQTALFSFCDLFGLPEEPFMKLLSSHFQREHEISDWRNAYYTLIKIREKGGKMILENGSIVVKNANQCLDDGLREELASNKDFIIAAMRHCAR
jgi:hypothetical protein